MSDDGKDVRFSLVLIEYADGSTSCESVGRPTIAQVLGLLEIWRACKRVDAINSYAAQQRDSRKPIKKRRATSKERK